MSSNYSYFAVFGKTFYDNAFTLPKGLNTIGDALDHF